MFLEQIDFEHFKKTGEIRASESYFKELTNYTKLRTGGQEYIYPERLAFLPYLKKQIVEFPQKLKGLYNYLINFNKEELDDLIGEFIYHAIDFITGDSKTLVAWLVLACLQLHSGYLMFTKLLSHERSKKLYFVLYLISITFVIVKCLLLVNLKVTDKSEEGIIFVYIYASATLMLFLIFLALTTCESYLYKDKDLTGIDREVAFIKLIINNTLICIPIFFYYLGLLKECDTLYYFKLNFFKKEPKHTLNHWEYLRDLEKKAEATRRLVLFPEEVIISEKKPISVLGKLKQTILDSKYSYMLSALLQLVTLISIIITSVI